MKEKNQHILKKAIGELPAYQLENLKFWEIFDNQQDKKNNPQFRNLLCDLPKYVAPEGLWKRVEYGLNNRPKNRQSSSFHFLTRVAAMIAIILSIGFGLISIRYRYAIKSLPDSGVTKKFLTDSKDEMGIMSIWNPALCQGNPQICNTILFKALEKQLNEVKGEIGLMEPMIRNGDPQMMKYYYRLVNLRVEIKKKMVKIMMES
jgi:hypothetical protein